MNRRHGAVQHYWNGCRCVRCKDANAAYRRAQVAADPEKARKEAKRSNIKYRNKYTALIRAAKSTPCMDCGVQYPTYVMQFDHRNGKDKLFTISATNWAIEATIAEIAKCDVVCANCHAERTHARLVAL